MRLLSRKEKKKKGCIDCIYSIVKKVYVMNDKSNYYANREHCLFKECPFHELDKYESHAEYLKSQDCIKYKLYNTVK